MVVRLRLQRFGHKNQPFYRVVAADARAPRDGKFIEIVGTYNPIPTRDGYKEVRFNRQRIEYWLGVGAEPSERVAWLLGQFNILPLVPRRIFTQNHLPKKERAELLAAQQSQQKKAFSTSAACAAAAAAEAPPAGAPLPWKDGEQQALSWLADEVKGALAAADEHCSADAAAPQAAEQQPPASSPRWHADALPLTGLGLLGLQELTARWNIRDSSALSMTSNVAPE